MPGRYLQIQRLTIWKFVKATAQQLRIRELVLTVLVLAPASHAHAQVITCTPRTVSQPLLWELELLLHGPVASPVQVQLRLPSQAAFQLTLLWVILQLHAHLLTLIPMTMVLKP